MKRPGICLLLTVLAVAAGSLALSSWRPRAVIVAAAGGAVPLKVERLEPALDLIVPAMHPSRKSLPGLGLNGLKVLYG